MAPPSAFHPHGGHWTAIQLKNEVGWGVGEILLPKLNSDRVGLFPEGLHSPSQFTEAHVSCQSWRGL